MDQASVYRAHADRYDALVAAEDCDGALGSALAELVAPGAAVLEVGAGTGRLTRLLLERGASVRAFDREPRMLRVAREKLAGLDGVELAVADAAALPVEDGWADAAVAGWVFGHFRSWMPTTWREEVGRALDEMRRALAPGGVVILFETLGTGVDRAHPPSSGLFQYYDWLERQRGFRRRVLQTDYRFDGVDDAAAQIGFFFGDELAARVRAEGWTRVPEYTGLWTWRAPT